jgi:hypothetical protein
MDEQALTISVPHQLGKQEAIERLKRGFMQASALAPVVRIEEQNWSSNELTFKVRPFGQIASASAQVSDGEVTFKIVLPPLLRSVAALLSNKFKSRAQVLLEKK